MLKHSVHASKYFFARTLKSQPVKKTDGAEFRHPDIPCFEVMRLSLEAGVFFASYYVQIPILPLSFSQHKNVAKTPLFRRKTNKNNDNSMPFILQKRRKVIFFFARIVKNENIVLKKLS